MLDEQRANDARVSSSSLQTQSVQYDKHLAQRQRFTVYKLLESDCTPLRKRHYLFGFKHLLEDRWNLSR